MAEWFDKVRTENVPPSWRCCKIVLLAKWEKSRVKKDGLRPVTITKM